ncbi:MAG: MBOAT family O-acyltransferase [Planctomycetaceae bacterium]
MLFHSWPFIFLLLATLAGCVVIAPSRRWYLLLVSSLVFYGWWRVDYLSLMLLTATSCYLAGLAIESTRVAWKRRTAMTAVVAVNIAVLTLFKYWGLLAELINTLTATGLRPELGWLLPVGISFYTFQSIGYTVDVYRGKVKAERNAARFLLFVSFFPQLVAGPIERASRLLPALRAPIHFTAVGFRFGLWMMLWGFFKKLVIADRAAIFADHGFDRPDGCGGLTLIFATYAFAIQIYCDFSAYSDIASGTARLFGIPLMRNFDRPYSAISLREFWARWHISLSTWFRDYVYLPLGGNRHGTTRRSLNLLIVFALSGLWHGPSWTFLWWGIMHACGRLAEHLWHPLPKSLRWVITFHFVVLGWVLFRSPSIDHAWQILTTVLQQPFSLEGFRPPDSSGLELPVLGLAMGWLWLIEQPLRRELHWSVRSWMGGRARRWALPAVLITGFLLLNFGLFSERSRFIYFQF